MSDENGYLTRREAELLVDAAVVAAAERLVAHQREHAQDATALELALATEAALRDEHEKQHAANHQAHDEKHAAEGEAVNTALDAVARERAVHAAAHEREHIAHQREHSLNNLAIDKAESATDKRFESTNAYREQINDMIRSLASRDSVEGLVKDNDRRFEDFRKEREARLDDVRRQIAVLEKTDVKAEGRGIGQGATIAYIVTAIGVVGVLLGIVAVLAQHIK